MIKKKIKYVDLDGNQVEEECYFNLSETEAIEWEYSKEGGMSSLLKKISEEADSAKIIGFMKELILKTYGKRSDDGKSFVKTKKLRKSFKNSLAFNALFMELGTDADKAAEFANGVLPKHIVDKIEKGSPQTPQKQIRKRPAK